MPAPDGHFEAQGFPGAGGRDGSPGGDNDATHGAVDASGLRGLARLLGSRTSQPITEIHVFHQLNASTVLGLLAAALFLGAPTAAIAHGPRTTVEDVIGSELVPYAIGHRGSGDNLGEDPDRPIENTHQSVRQAYADGMRIVEVDVNLTGDGRVVSYHDDFLPDFTCINTLTVGEMRDRIGDVSTLRQVLRKARQWSRRKGEPQGVLVVELKQPAPFCDPFDEGEAALVEAVVDLIRAANMTDQVIFDSFSPSLLALAAASGPEIRGGIALSALQLLPPATIEALLGVPVVYIDKDAGFGLQWAEIGPTYRMPGYASIDQFIGVAFALGVRTVDVDMLVLAEAEQTQPGSGAALVATLKSFGFGVTSYTVISTPEWLFLESLGVEGIYTNDIPAGAELQAQ